MDHAATRRREIQSHIEEVDSIRHKARYTVDTYNEESKSIKQFLANKKRYALYFLLLNIAEAILPRFPRGVVVAAGATFFVLIAVVAVLLSTWPHWSVAALAAVVCFLHSLPFFNRAWRAATCDRMRGLWDEVWREGEGVRKDFQDEYEHPGNVDAQHVLMDLVARVRRLRGMRQRVLDMNVQTDNAAYQTARRNLNATFERQDIAESRRRFELPGTYTVQS